jgi:uncharacterized protein
MNKQTPESSLETVYLLREFAVPVSQQEPDLVGAIAGFLRVKKNLISQVQIQRKSLDSRRRNQPVWRYALEFTFKGTLKHPRLKWVRDSNNASQNPSDAAAKEQVKYQAKGKRIAIIGSGPAGMGAAMGLLRKGFEVEVFEQGSEVANRFRDIRQFMKGDRFNPHSNILFGEGGAGTFSDGKLTCRTRTPYTEAFLRELVASGADEDITYLSHPHIGTDKLQFIITAFRKRCEALGGRYRFNTPVTDILIKDGKVSGIEVEGKSEAFDAVVLAAGHSSRVLYLKLMEHGVSMERKPFSVGVRVEHPQEMVNRRQLGENVDVKKTGAAEYYLTWNDEAEGLSAYSFCMCPGGVIVPCADADDGLFTNGMSYSNRAGAFANSAVVVPVGPADLPGSETLAGLDFIRELEVKAYQLGGGAFTFPAQTILAFMENRVDALVPPKTSFTKPLKWSNFRDLFPPKIALALQEAFRNFDQKLPGFISQGLIIGPESRTSSPVRILRNPLTLESLSTPGLFPLGEGAGYSGGIVSSGADGFRLAEAWLPIATTSPVVKVS